jgi:hypothetical protein
MVEERDPESGLVTYEEVMPVVTVTAAGYLDGDVLLNFYKPKLVLRVQPIAVQVGLATQQATVYADDEHTHAQVSARVKIGADDVAATNTTFTRSFAPGALQGFVTATAYPNAMFAFAALTSDAAYVSQLVPATMVAGQSYPVSVTMRNAGTTTWVAGGSYPFRLGSQAPQDNMTWGTARCDVPGPVPPGAQTNFSFTVVAPAPGTRHFQWRMLQEAVQWFGVFSPDTQISIVPLALNVSVTPYPLRLNVSVQANVRAASNGNGQLVAGDVLVNGVRVAGTNSTFTYTFRTVRKRVWEPEVGWVYIDAPPTVTVSATGFPVATVDIGALPA